MQNLLLTKPGRNGPKSESVMLPMKILFICTHNRCRSILAEVVANHYSEGLIEAASGGSEPAEQIHPLTVKALERNLLPVKGLYSKSWHDLEGFEPDFVITVCDKAAHEKCPLWFGMSLKAHWGLVDPSVGAGTEEEEQMQAFDTCIEILIRRIKKLTALLQQDPGRTAVLTLLNSLAEEN